MKNVFKIFIIIAVVAFAGTASAQTKIGYIESDKIVEIMPGKDSIEAKLMAYRNNLESQMQSMGVEYQTKVTEYQSNYQTYSELIRQTKEEEIRNLEQRITKFQQTVEYDFAKKREELFTPMLEKIQDAINAVAKENGYNYVFDASLGAMLFYENGDNILPLVKAKLGIK